MSTLRGILPVLVLVGCGDASGPAPVVDLMAGLPDSTAVLRVGVNDDSPGMLARPRAGAITPAGQVIVLDDVAPFIRIFTASGALQRTFAEEGDGPGEVRMPYDVAARDDRILLLAGRITEFDTAGAVTASAPRGDLVPINVAAGCAADWIVYGVRRNGDGTGFGSEWLHTIRVDTSGTITSRSHLATVSDPARVGMGKPTVLGRSGGHFVLFHEHGQPAGYYRWTCGREPEPWPGALRALPAIEEATATRADATTTVFSSRLTDPQPAGLLAIGDALIQFLSVARFSAPGAAPDVSTTLRLISSGGGFELELPGRYRPLKTGPDGQALIAVDEPYPQVLVIPGEQLIEMLRTHGRVLTGR
jgi:hypothetical protein